MVNVHLRLLFASSKSIHLNRVLLFRRCLIFKVRSRYLHTSALSVSDSFSEPLFPKRSIILPNIFPFVNTFFKKTFIFFILISSCPRGSRKVVFLFDKYFLSAFIDLISLFDIIIVSKHLRVILCVLKKLNSR